MPLSESDPVDHPISMYGVTKRCNELMAHTYSHIYGLPTTGLRFFTVYGPWARPDMALFSFAESIHSNKPITVFNHGKMTRDFTYVTDISGAIISILNKVPQRDLTKSEQGLRKELSTNQSFGPFEILNIGSNQPVALLKYIELIETHLNKKAIIQFEELQPGDLTQTHADLTNINELIDYKPQVNIEKGIENFCEWFKKWKAQ
jgi:UDP-glucuronate 4-epimerase